MIHCITGCLPQTRSFLVPLGSCLVLSPYLHFKSRWDTATTHFLCSPLPSFNHCVCQSKSQSLPEAMSLDPSSVDTASEEAQKQLARLLRRIDDCCESLEEFQNGQVKLVLYFDEAHALAEKNLIKDPDGENIYDVMCSCFNSFLSSHIFVRQIQTLATPGPLARSGQAYENASALQAPVTETPFHCFPEFLIKPGELGWEDVCEVEFMARFGHSM